jgi:hypothetical protein
MIDFNYELYEYVAFFVASSEIRNPSLRYSTWYHMETSIMEASPSATDFILLSLVHSHPGYVCEQIFETIDARSQNQNLE